LRRERRGSEGEENGTGGRKAAMGERKYSMVGREEKRVILDGLMGSVRKDRKMAGQPEKL
jgi:hypothetical protein